MTTTETNYGLTIAAGKSAKIQIPENRVLPFPVAPTISVRLEFDRQTLFVGRALSEHRNPVAGGAYLFPGKRADLPDGWYWTDGQSHVTGSNHRSSSSQRFAYDFVVRRWDGKRWTSRKAGDEREAQRGQPDLGPARARDGGRVDPPLRPDEGGQRARREDRRRRGTSSASSMRTARSRSTPTCARDSIPADAVPEARRGRLRGDGGARGGGPVPRPRRQHRRSPSGPHLHVHVDTTGETDGGQGRPLHFRNIRTRFAGVDWDASPPCDLRNRSFAVAKGASASWRQLVEPLWPSGAGELTKFGLRETCFQDYGDEAVASGYKPVWFDGYDVGGNVVRERRVPAGRRRLGAAQRPDERPPTRPRSPTGTRRATG